jgi:hypothetical protein
MEIAYGDKNVEGVPRTLKVVGGSFATAVMLSTMSAVALIWGSDVSNYSHEH